MGLGILLKLALLTVSEFAPVLAHEFAHYYGGDTSLGLCCLQNQVGVDGANFLENIGSVRASTGAHCAFWPDVHGRSLTLLKWFFMAFLRGINVVSRKQEYRADELACLIAGRRNLISGVAGASSCRHRVDCVLEQRGRSRTGRRQPGGGGRGFLPVRFGSRDFSRNQQGPGNPSARREDPALPYPSSLARSHGSGRKPLIQPSPKIPNPRAACWRICPPPKCNLSST